MDIPTDDKAATTLLYVEDDDLTQKFVIQILKLKFPQITILLAQNGQQGLDIYTDNRPGIVLTDVRMPIIDGIQMAKKIKKMDKNAQIIILSAASEVDYILDAIDVGINNYVLKPIAMDKLIAAVERCLDKIYLSEQLKQHISEEWPTMIILPAFPIDNCSVSFFTSRWLMHSAINGSCQSVTSISMDSRRSMTPSAILSVTSF